MTLFDIVAMGGNVPAGYEQDPRAGQFTMILTLVVMGVMFYFLLIRPQSKQRKEHDAMLKNVKGGDRVLTSGGIYGIVMSTKDKTLTLKIADNVKVEVAKSAVTSVVNKSPDEPAANGK